MTHIHTWKLQSSKGKYADFICKCGATKIEPNRESNYGFEKKG